MKVTVSVYLTKRIEIQVSTKYELPFFFLCYYKIKVPESVSNQYPLPTKSPPAYFIPRFEPISKANSFKTLQIENPEWRIKRIGINSKLRSLPFVTGFVTSNLNLRSLSLVLQPNSCPEIHRVVSIHALEFNGDIKGRVTVMSSHLKTLQGK